MAHLERVWEDRNRTPVLFFSGAIMLVVAVVDWWTMPYVSLGFLYLFPIMLVAGFLPRWAVAAMGVVCAMLAELFSSLDRSVIRFSFEALALAGCGLFIAELSRNRRLSMEAHRVSLAAQERLRALVETSSAAIVKRSMSTDVSNSPIWPRAISCFRAMERWWVVRLPLSPPGTAPCLTAGGSPAVSRFDAMPRASWETEKSS